MKVHMVLFLSFLVGQFSIPVNTVVTVEKIQDCQLGSMNKFGIVHLLQRANVNKHCKTEAKRVFKWKYKKNYFVVDNRLDIETYEPIEEIGSFILNRKNRRSHLISGLIIAFL